MVNPFMIGSIVVNSEKGEGTRARNKGRTKKKKSKKKKKKKRKKGKTHKSKKRKRKKKRVIRIEACINRLLILSLSINPFSNKLRIQV